MGSRSSKQPSHPFNDPTSLILHEMSNELVPSGQFIYNLRYHAISSTDGNVNSTVIFPRKSAALGKFVQTQYNVIDVTQLPSFIPICFPDVLVDLILQYACAEHEVKYVQNGIVNLHASDTTENMYIDVKKVGTHTDVHVWTAEEMKRGNLSYVMCLGLPLTWEKVDNEHVVCHNCCTYNHTLNIHTLVWKHEIRR